MSRRTERAYVDWIGRYVRYHGLRHPADMGEREVVAYLTYLADERRVARSTQVQAMSALLLLYKDVLEKPVGDVRAVLRSRAPARLPTVLSRAEVAGLLTAMAPPARLIALLLYGGGLRLMEYLTLRMKDLDLSRGEIRVRRGKGGKDRVTMLSTAAKPLLERQMDQVGELHERDLRAGGGRVELAGAARAQGAVVGVGHRLAVGFAVAEPLPRPRDDAPVAGRL